MSVTVNAERQRTIKRRLNRVARVLRRAEVDEFVITESTGRRVVAHLSGVRTIHSTDRRELEVVIYRDLRRGRTSARFVVADDDLDAIERLVNAASKRARGGLGPEWKLPPPAAPARVDVADPAIVADTQGVALAIIEQLVRGADKPGGTALSLGSARVACEARETSVHTSSGFLRTKSETFLELDAVLRTSTTSQPVRRQARRRADIDVAALVQRARARLAARAVATRLAPRRYDLVLGLDAIVCADARPAAGVDRYRWFTSFVAQADAENQRRGLVRYRPGEPVFGERTPTTELTLTSDGTLPFGWYSTPFTDLGQAVRSFHLIKDGTAAQLALGLREAGLRKQAGNGGVRNLVLSPGRASEGALLSPGPRPLLVVDEVVSFACEPQNGEFSAQLGLAHIHHDKTRRPVVAGYVRGNLFELFANVQLAEETSFHTWYAGPQLIRFPNVKVQ